MIAPNLKVAAVLILASFRTAVGRLSSTPAIHRWIRPLAHGVVAAAVVALVAASMPRAWGDGPTQQQLQALEKALNTDGRNLLSDVLEASPGFDLSKLENRRRLLLQHFPNARWVLRFGAPLDNGEATIHLTVTGSRQEGPVRYSLQAEQLLALRSNGRRFNGQTVLREQALLRSGEEPLPVSVLIPDRVLTGQRYDIDVIFDDPLDGAIVAGGILALSPTQVALMESPSIPLAALSGGGLFKTVQAPLTPGSQTWGVLLVHPKGVVTATKRVQVVTDSDLQR